MQSFLALIGISILRNKWIIFKALANVLLNQGNNWRRRYIEEKNDTTEIDKKRNDKPINRITAAEILISRNFNSHIFSLIIILIEDCSFCLGFEKKKPTKPHKYTHKQVVFARAFHHLSTTLLPARRQKSQYFSVLGFLYSSFPFSTQVISCAFYLHSFHTNINLLQNNLIPLL